LSFDEARQQKEVLLVELDGSGLRDISALPVPRFQPLLALRGSLVELQQAIAEAAQQGSSEMPVWLEVQVSTDDYLSDLHLRIAALCEGLPVEVLRIRRERGNSVAALQGQARETLDELSVEEVFAQRLSSETLDDAQQAPLLALYRQVVGELREGEA
jgi:exonuclease SbcD